MNIMTKIIRTQEFVDNISKIKDDKLTTVITQRLLRIKEGNFGDTKSIGDDVFELRIHYKAGYRIYYTIRKQEIIILLCSGSKSEQKKDIIKAKLLAREVYLNGT